MVPSLRRDAEKDLETANDKKAQILGERFIPPSGGADLSDIDPAREHDRFEMECLVTPQQLKDVIKSLPNGKAPGPDQIQNEVWKRLRKDIVEDVADAITDILRTGKFPQELRESTTVVLRKDKKKDYSLPGSYRPIVLENTISKIVKKIVANRITFEMEKRELIPWNQMGARGKISTLSAIEMLTGTTKTAWAAKHPLVSVLALDLAGAFDNVSHARLLWVFRRKGYPEWVVQYVQSLLTNRRTRISLSEYDSEWIPTNTGISQGSTLSPVLFLFFIADLLEIFE